MMNPDTREIEAVMVYRDRLEYQIFDDAIRGDIEALQRLNAGELLISDRSDDDTTWLVAFDDDSGPVKFYTWDRAAKAATFLFDHRPQLNDYPLVPMEPFSFTARDGLTIHGYLVLPGRGRAHRPARRPGGARRPVGARRVGAGSRGAVAREPRLRVCARELPWLQRVRQGLPQRG